MTDPKHNPRSFGSIGPAPLSGVPCDEVEAMLADALDDVLTEDEQLRFDRHLTTCAACARMVADARRGAALLEMLRMPRPEPSAALFDRIIAQTSGAQASTAMQNALHVVPQATPVAPFTAPAAAVPSNVLSFPQRFGQNFRMAALQPRLAMTAAMAFFSIALTFNLIGVHPTQLHAADLTPSSIKRTAYSTGASAVRYFDSLRVVYELESRVHDLKRDDDQDPAQPAPKSNDPGTQEQNKNQPNHSAPRAGSSRRDGFTPSHLLAVDFQEPKNFGQHGNHRHGLNVWNISKLISLSERERAPRKGGLA